MRTCIRITTTTGNHDAIIDHDFTPLKDTKQHIIWANAENATAKCKGKCFNITIYEQVEGVCRPIVITTESIKSLAKIIEKLESVEIEREFD